MTKAIKPTGPKAARVESTSKPAERVAPHYVARELGAEHVMSMPATASPPVLAELRRQIFGMVKSTGGRPGIEGAEHRQKIPMSSEDLARLEELAKQVADERSAPTPGQVGALLLHGALDEAYREIQAWSVSYPRGLQANEPTATYIPGASSRTTAKQAARKHLQQAQDAGDARTGSSVRDRCITQLSIENLALLFTPPGLPVVDKGAPSPTTSIAVLGEAGAGKTTLAVSLAQAIAADANGLALYLTTELAPTEIKYKISLLGVSAAVVAWRHRSAAQPGDIIGQHVSLLEATDDAAPVRQRALEAAWQLVDGSVSEPPIRCVVIDAFPLPELSSSAARDEVVTLIQALEGRGISVVIVQEAMGSSDFVPFVADVVFQLRFAEDADTGEWLRKLGCPKSRYARVLAGPHATGVDRDRVTVWPAPLAAGKKRLGASRH